MSSWFGGGQQKRPGHVDWGRWVKRDEERAQQLLIGLIVINVLVFVAWSQSRGSILAGLMQQHFLVSVESIAHFRIWTLLTSEFSHYSATHLLFNLLGLWVFGRDVGRMLGSRAVLHLYLAGAIAASVGHVLYGVVTGDPSPALGASGAVMAFAVVFAAMFPNRTLMINFFIPVPAGIAVGIYILLDVAGAFGIGGGGVANAAHLGGAAYGLAYWYLRVKRR